LVVALAALGFQPGHARAQPSAGAAIHGTEMRREQRSVSFVLNASADDAFPLFGPRDEGAWADGWTPRWVFPADGSQSAAGAVFYTVPASSKIETIWIMPTYDPAARVIDYYFVTPGHVTAELHISVVPEGSTRARTSVTYRYTALSDAGNAFIAKWADEFPKSGPHWAEHINRYLETRKAHDR
jgi:hypothetical protein